MLVKKWKKDSKHSLVYELSLCTYKILSCLFVTYFNMGLSKNETFFLAKVLSLLHNILTLFFFHFSVAFFATKMEIFWSWQPF